MTNYTSADGLAQSQVLALHQDRQGFLWIGSYRGLTRFDGVEFKTLTRRDGLTAHSELGRGARFRIYLPMAQAPEVQPLSPVSCRQAADQVTGQVVLVAEG